MAGTSRTEWIALPAAVAGREQTPDEPFGGNGAIFPEQVRVIQL
jgi:hypothetical protein